MVRQATNLEMSIITRHVFLCMASLNTNSQPDISKQRRKGQKKLNYRNLTITVAGNSVLKGKCVVAEARDYLEYRN